MRGPSVPADRTNHSNRKGMTGWTKKGEGTGLRREARRFITQQTGHGRQRRTFIRDLAEKMIREVPAMTAEVLRPIGRRTAVVSLNRAGRAGHGVVAAAVRFPRRRHRCEQNKEKQYSHHRSHDLARIIDHRECCQTKTAQLRTQCRRLFGVIAPAVHPRHPPQAFAQVGRQLIPVEAPAPVAVEGVKGTRGQWHYLKRKNF